MKIEYVDQSEIGLAGRKKTHPWAEFFEELYKDDSMTRWGVFPILINSASGAYAAAKKYKDIKINVKRAPDGVKWIVYGQYQPGLWDRMNEEEVF